MKQKFLLALILVCSFVVSTKAQISQGAVWAGGSIGYTQSTNDYEDVAKEDYKHSSLDVAPSIGFAVKDNLVVGVRLLYGQDKSKNDAIDSKTNSYGGGVFVRRYIPVINRLYLFGEAIALYSSSKGDATIQDNSNGYYTSLKRTSKGMSANLNVTPGLAVAITKKLQLETSLNSLFNVGYQKSKMSTDRPGSTYNNQTIDQFTAGIFTDGKVQFNIGCRFLL